MIAVLCDYCGARADFPSARLHGWTLVHHDDTTMHFCTIDCVLFWGARKGAPA